MKGSKLRKVFRKPIKKYRRKQKRKSEVKVARRVGEFGGTTTFLNTYRPKPVQIQKSQMNAITIRNTSQVGGIVNDIYGFITFDPAGYGGVWCSTSTDINYTTQSGILDACPDFRLYAQIYNMYKLKKLRLNWHGDISSANVASSTLSGFRMATRYLYNNAIVEAANNNNYNQINSELATYLPNTLPMVKLHTFTTEHPQLVDVVYPKIRVWTSQGTGDAAYAPSYYKKSPWMAAGPNPNTVASSQHLGYCFYIDRLLAGESISLDIDYVISFKDNN